MSALREDWQVLLGLLPPGWEQLGRSTGAVARLRGFNSLKGRPVRLVDATVVKEPGKTGSQWRIHYSIRLPSLECDQFDLTPVEGKNTGERLGRFTFQSGELVLADAGYSNPPDIAAAVKHADVCVRLNRS